MKNTVAILFAMKDEARPLIDALSCSKTDTFDEYFPATFFESDDKKIIIAVFGTDPVYRIDSIGTQAAAVVTLMTIKKYNPSLIISAGTAGAFQSKGASIGDIYLSRKVAFHDRRIALPGFDKYGFYILETPDALPLAEKLNYKPGNITSGNSLDMTEQDLKNIQSWGGEIKEMEAASIGWICSLYRKSFFAVKSVTDLMDAGRSTEEEFLENLHMASEKLSQALLKILEVL